MKKIKQIAKSLYANTYCKIGVLTYALLSAKYANAATPISGSSNNPFELAKTKLENIGTNLIEINKWVGLVVIAGYLIYAHRQGTSLMSVVRNVFIMLLVTCLGYIVEFAGE